MVVLVLPPLFVCAAQERPTDKASIANTASKYWATQAKRIAVLEFDRDRKSMSVLCDSGNSTRSTGRVTRNSTGPLEGSHPRARAHCSRTRAARPQRPHACVLTG